MSASAPASAGHALMRGPEGGDPRDWPGSPGALRNAMQSRHNTKLYRSRLGVRRLLCSAPSQHAASPGHLLRALIEEPTETAVVPGFFALADLVPAEPSAAAGAALPNIVRALALHCVRDQHQHGSNRLHLGRVCGVSRGIGLRHRERARGVYGTRWGTPHAVRVAAPRWVQRRRWRHRHRALSHPGEALPSLRHRGAVGLPAPSRLI